MRSMETQIKDNALNAADIVRERETYRYLNTANIHAYVDDTEQPLPAARPCADTALAAFAQLALLRLNSQRALVCLLDRTYCYTVAEATASSKLRPPAGNEDTEHGLVFCGTATRHAFSLPSLILEATLRDLLSAGESDSLSLPVLVVPDLRRDERFCSVPAVAAENSLKSCTGVPIKSHNGAVIGVFCVLDSQLRPGLSHVDTEFLRDMSKTIMDQLDFYYSRREFDRSTRMVRGLGSFVENRGTMSGLFSDSKLWSSEFEDGSGREGMLNNSQQEALRKTKKEENTPHATASHSEETALSSATIAKDWGDQSQQRSSQIEPLAEPWSGGSVESWLSLSQPVTESSLAPDNEQSQGYNEAVSASSQPVQTTTKNPPLLGDELQQLFSRAANIIRESIEVEGVLFFDASVGYWGGLLESGRRDTSEGGSSNTSATSSSGDDDALPTRSTIRTNTDETTCDVFGFSMTDGSSIDGEKPSAGHLTVPERFLRILLRRYPTGKIFNFTADGRHVSDTETDEDSIHAPAPVQEVPARIRRKRYNSHSRVNEAALIASVFPGARSVLAFPLWDSHRERWFAGGVVWTRTPTRVFSIKGELSYLRAFGMVAMAEVARMDAQTANKSKATLLSSISHELRSPLHGILGGVEILQSTEIDVFQSNTIDAVETCGVMLLDTIEHLLTQSEINQSVRLAKLRRHKWRNPKLNDVEGQASGMINSPSNVEVDVVVEEVIESMFAGYEFMHLSRPPPKSTDDEVKSPSMAAGGLPSIQDASPSPVQENIKVIFDIQVSASWTFGLEPGALRRVVMNLFGNALKYTTAGYIKVTVTQRELSKKRTAKLSEINIKVEDTGKGIGAEFLSNHLFKPFSQEDTLSQGTGLGLSITHQIVASLDGKIDVQSTVGRGTAMSVFLRLTHSVPKEGPRAKSLFLVQTGRTRGLRVSLFGFHEDAGAASGETSSEVPKADIEWQLPRASIKQLCQEWLYMDVLAASETSMRPDVYISTQAGAQELAAMKDTGICVQPVVVICPSAAIARDLTKSSKASDKFGVFEYLSQPCGPRKLAKTLTLCLDRWADMQVEQAIQGPSPSHLAAPAHVQSTLPKRTESTPSTSLQTELSLNVPEDPSPASLSPSIEHQKPEHHPFLHSKPPEAEFPRHAFPLTSGLTLTEHVAPFLLVDDNEINLKLLSAYLSRKSLPFAMAVDGVLAVAAYKAARGNFSCVFMDIQMPHMDGIAATRKIREYERQEMLEAVTVVALTGLATEEKQREAEANGINEFFAKPVRLKALDEILERTVRTIK